MKKKINKNEIRGNVKCLNTETIQDILMSTR
ncbi:unnamed protein product [Nezara viridula]|uniref:Uncharacterized protein n=1 Tax=Nezara viridula TaxID=85310 RepID=A0A9P0E2G8_NEZVI|nr:unnamed protein product [Nezara viridula]